ncbi:DinB family protein [Intrasporangium sp.]|uniref:DinB family protein n=1 Tax=Intrasporangium sp. TaxID=1925024 RepID=UPI0032215B0F
MSEPDLKQALTTYLQSGRDIMLWKLDGLSEYDARRPLTPTGTNLLGLVKHLAGVEAGYFGFVVGRPFPEPMSWWADDAEPNADMWATTDESRADVVDLYRRVWAHTDESVAALPLEHRGEVPWWPEERRRPTLHTLLVHVVAETHRHAGHADIVRESIDGSAGARESGSNLPSAEPGWWAGYRARLEDVARRLGGLPPLA